MSTVLVFQKNIDYKFKENNKLNIEENLFAKSSKTFHLEINRFNWKTLLKNGKELIQILFAFSVMNMKTFLSIALLFIRFKLWMFKKDGIIGILIQICFFNFHLISWESCCSHRWRMCMCHKLFWFLVFYFRIVCLIFILFYFRV